MKNTLPTLATIVILLQKCTGVICLKYILNYKAVPTFKARKGFSFFSTNLCSKVSNSDSISIFPRSDTSRSINAATTVAAKVIGLSILGLAMQQASFPSDLGFINLNETIPTITDVCWFDVKIGDYAPERIEISLFGDVTPITAANFKELCVNTESTNSYKGSQFFRIISSFSVQGGSIGSQEDTPSSRVGRYGRSASGELFPPENFIVNHSFRESGVISMMKDPTNKSLQDSRFFITISPDASWADLKYTAFGIVSKGMNVINKIALLPVEPPSNHPKTRVVIVDSGVYEKEFSASRI